MRRSTPIVTPALLAAACAATVRAQPGTAVEWGAYSTSSTHSGNFAQLSLGYLFSVGLRPSGKIEQWNSAPVTCKPGTNDRFVAISAGEWHVLALRSDGTCKVWCVPNEYGRPFDEEECKYVPDDLPTAVQIAAGEYHNVIIADDGTLTAWSSPDHENSDTLTCPSGTYRAISAGDQYTVAIKDHPGYSDDGTLVAWGRHDHDQIYPPSGKFKAVSAGQYHGVAIIDHPGYSDDGELRGWGQNTFGQAGTFSGSCTSQCIGTFPGSHPPYIEVSCGYQNTIAMRADGTLDAWGLDYPPGPLYTGIIEELPTGAFWHLAQGQSYFYGAALRPGSNASCYANCDGSTSSPVLGTDDYYCFLIRFALGDSWANCDGSTTPPVLNANDFACFVNMYAAGCS